MATYPEMLQTVFDTTEPRSLAEFYRQLLGYSYRDGDAPPAEGRSDDADWLVLLDASGARKLAFQLVDELPETTWPSAGIPMQLHIDFTVADVDELELQRDRALGLGARLVLDRRDDPDEPLNVLADPSGHPFCVFVA